MMDAAGSVTHWIKALRLGDQEAAAALWDRYFRRLAAIARQQIGAVRQAGDASDVALSAMHSFFDRLDRGELAGVERRDELWRVLVVITKRRAISWVRHELAAVRGGGKVRGQTYLSEVVSDEPTPQFTAELLDEFHHLMDVLRKEDGTLSLIAKRKSEGCTNREIAGELSLSIRTIERKFERICIIWAADCERRWLDSGNAED